MLLIYRSIRPDGASQFGPRNILGDARRCLSVAQTHRDIVLAEWTKQQNFILSAMIAQFLDLFDCNMPEMIDTAIVSVSFAAMRYWKL
jgi:hypothetical protein